MRQCLLGLEVSHWPQVAIDMLLAVMPQPLPLPFGGTERRFPMCKRLATFERLWNQRLSKRPLTCSAAFAPGEKAQGGFFGAPLRAMPRGAYYC